MSIFHIRKVPHILTICDSFYFLLITVLLSWGLFSKLHSSRIKFFLQPAGCSPSFDSWPRLPVSWSKCFIFLLPVEICSWKDGLAEALHQWKGFGSDDLYGADEQNVWQNYVIANQAHPVVLFDIIILFDAFFHIYIYYNAIVNFIYLIFKPFFSPPPLSD